MMAVPRVPYLLLSLQGNVVHCSQQLLEEWLKKRKMTATTHLAVTLRKASDHDGTAMQPIGRSASDTKS
jgi:hypothetical protein